MSLQAKIEAVIYASEEPVTLPQLMGLLGEEAQAELDALDSQQASLRLEPDEFGAEPAGEAAGDADALNAEVLETPELEEMLEAPTPPDSEAGDGDPSASLRNDNQSAEPEATTETTSVDDKKQARDKERRLREYFRSLIDRLMADYASSDRGLEIREVAGGFRMATKPEFHDAVRGFVKSLKPPMKLSLQALETLAVVAYKQPVTAPEISEIRGVESGGVLGTLMARKLIGTAGRKAVIGRPMLYKTSKEFLLRFGLKDINELPSIEEFEKMAGELNEPVQEEIPMEDAAEGRSSEESVEMVSGDGSPVLDELNSVPGQTSVAESSDEVAATPDRGAAGANTEPSSGVSQEAAASVEVSRDIHEAQADGVPEADADVESIDNHEPYTGSDETGA